MCRVSHFEAVGKDNLSIFKDGNDYYAKHTKCCGAKRKRDKIEAEDVMHEKVSIKIIKGITFKSGSVTIETQRLLYYVPS